MSKNTVVNKTGSQNAQQGPKPQTPNPPTPRSEPHPQGPEPPRIPAMRPPRSERVAYAHALRANRQHNRSRKANLAQLAQLMHAFVSIEDLSYEQLESLKTQAATVMDGYFYDVCSVLLENRSKTTGDNSSDALSIGLTNIAFLRAFQLAKAETFRAMEPCEISKLTQLLAISSLNNLLTEPQSNSQKTLLSGAGADSFDQCFPAEAINIYRDGPNNKALPGGRRPRKRSSTFACSEINQKRDYICNSLAPSCARKVVEMTKNCAIDLHLDGTEPTSIEKLCSICKCFQNA